MTSKENITVTEAFGFWVKNKEYIWRFAFLILGAFGANVDAIATAIPDVWNVKGLTARVTAVEADVEALKNKTSVDVPVSTDDGFKTERPKIKTESWQ